jgi:hypothetical protein
MCDTSCSLCHFLAPSLQMGGLRSGIGRSSKRQFDDPFLCALFDDGRAGNNILFGAFLRRKKTDEGCH